MDDLIAVLQFIASFITQISTVIDGNIILTIAQGLIIFGAILYVVLMVNKDKTK